MNQHIATVRVMLPIWAYNHNFHNLKLITFLPFYCFT